MPTYERLLERSDEPSLRSKRQSGEASGQAAISGPATTEQHVLTLEHSAGDSAIARLLNSARHLWKPTVPRPRIRRRYWDNQAAQFQTENEEGAAELGVRRDDDRISPLCARQLGTGCPAQKRGRTWRLTQQGNREVYGEAWNSFSQVVFENTDRNFAYFDDTKMGPYKDDNRKWDAAVEEPLAYVAGGGR